MILYGNTEQVLPELKNYFCPELIYRIDESIVFHSLTKEVISEILDKVIQEIQLRSQESDIMYGVRSLK